VFRSPGMAKYGINHPGVLNSNAALTAPHFLNLAVRDDASKLPEIIIIIIVIIIIIIIIITIIISIINCNLVVTRWQWLFYMYTNMEKSN